MQRSKWAIVVLVMILGMATLYGQETIVGETIIEWADQSSNEDGFRIEYRIGADGVWTTLTTVDANVTEYGPFSLPVDTYYFRVCAFNTYGDSEYSNLLSLVFQDPAPETPSMIGISRQGDDILLEWSAVTNATSYKIYRGTRPDFTANASSLIASNVQDADASKTGIQWIDENSAVNNINVNYFYLVSAVINSTEGSCGDYMGEFEYSLITTAKTNFNEIAIPVALAGVTNAQELMAALPNCNSIAKWHAGYQTYLQYVPGIQSTNFEVVAGEPYYVHVTQSSIALLTGQPVQKNFDLITTPKTDFNEIVLPFSKSNIATAEELMNDIPNCNSVAYWHAGYQTYMQYVPGITSTNFSVKPGYPYYVNVTGNVSWPYGAAKTVIVNTIASAEVQESSHAPHIVWGNMDFAGRSIDPSEIKMKAYVRTRPDDILTEASIGSGVEDNTWMIQVSGFNSPWKAGEEVVVELTHDVYGVLGETTVELTYAPADQSGSLDNPGNESIPVTFALDQNYPNPFNPSTVIPYRLSQETHVKITVYNVIGQEVVRLVDGVQGLGYHEITWNGTDRYGQKVSSNMYVVSMEAADFRQSRKVIFNQ